MITVEFYPGMPWELLVRANKARLAAELLGSIPAWLNPANPEPAAKQLDAGYRHGGGWIPFGKGVWEMGDGGTLALKPIAKAQLRDETIYVYEYTWVAIVQKDGSFEVARMD